MGIPRQDGKRLYKSVHIEEPYHTWYRTLPRAVFSLSLPVTKYPPLRQLWRSTIRTAGHRSVSTAGWRCIVLYRQTADPPVRCFEACRLPVLGQPYKFISQCRLWIHFLLLTFAEVIELSNRECGADDRTTGILLRPVLYSGLFLALVFGDMAPIQPHAHKEVSEAIEEKIGKREGEILLVSMIRMRLVPCSRHNLGSIGFCRDVNTACAISRMPSCILLPGDWCRLGGII